MGQTMVERMAEAEAKIDGYADLLAMSRPQRERYMLRARAALEAMREPNLSMDQAGADEGAWDKRHFGNYSACARAVYRAMIDAALAEG